MILNIVQIGSTVLRKNAENIKDISENIIKLIDNMVETMHEAGGVGLAAPQIGKAINLAVIDISSHDDFENQFVINNKEKNIKQHMPLILINPVFKELDKNKISGVEGCLSIQDIREKVKRFDKIEVKFTDKFGNKTTLITDGFLSRVIQHEIDHLNGILFIDRINSISKMKIKKKIKHLIDQNSCS